MNMDLSGIKAMMFAISWICSSATILDVRLQDGDSPTSGRIEVNVEGIGWNTICGSSWNMNDVIVTCRQLGFTGAQMELSRSEFGSGTAPVYKKIINCKGKENNLDDCQMLSQTCRGSLNGAGVVCQGPSYLGCYADNPLSRLLTGTSYVDSIGMTISDCITFCRLRDFEYAGLELGSECYCGDADSDYIQYGHFGDAECRHTCAGNNLETCGGIAKMAVHITATPTTVTMPSTRLSSARTPNPLEGTSPGRNATMMSPSSTSSTEVALTKISEGFEGSLSDGMMMIIVYILGALLFFCIVIVLGCLIWNCRLRSRITYNISGKLETPPGNDQTINAPPYMTLSERKNDGGNGYQSLSVQRKEAQRIAMPDGPYAESLGEPVYQEPAVYLEPDNVCSVSYKPGDPVSDELFLGGGNEYETLGM